MSIFLTMSTTDQEPATEQSPVEGKILDDDEKLSAPENMTERLSAAEPSPIIMEMPPKLTQPRYHKGKIQIWADLTVSDMDNLDTCGTADDIKLELAKLFSLCDYGDNLKSAVLIDLYYYIIQFARDNKFSKEQTSAFFSIVKRTHEICIETPFGNVAQCFAYFRELVLCHAVKRPPFSMDLFSPNEVKKITDYVVNTYFRHYKMYKYVFTPLVRLDLSMQYIGMPPSPEPSDGEEEEEEAEEEAVIEEPKDVEQNEVENQTENSEEESAAAKELRALIQHHLAEDLKKLKMNVDEQIKETEVSLNKKLEEAESRKGSGRKSAKKRK